MDERDRIDEAMEGWARITPDLDVVTMRTALVERRHDPGDGRSTLVVLTGVGEVKAIEAARAYVAAEAELFDTISPSDRADLRRVLETVLDTYCAVATEPDQTARRASPRSVETSTMRRCHDRSAQEVRPGVP